MAVSGISLVENFPASSMMPRFSIGLRQGRKIRPGRGGRTFKFDTNECTPNRNGLKNKRGNRYRKMDRLRKNRAKDEILIYIPSFAGGGVERVFVRIANEMARSGQAARFVVNRSSGPLRPLLSENVELIDLGARRTRHAVRPLARVLGQVRPAALISALTYNNFAALLARRRAGVSTRIVVSERAQVSGVLSDYSVARRLVTVQLLRRLYPLADAITAVSSGTADDLARLAGLDRRKIAVIPNAPPSRIEIDAARSAPSPHPWLEDRTGPVAVAIGRLEPQKNYPLMLDTLSRVRGQGVPLRLLVLGEGYLRADLIALTEALGLRDAVDFLGFVPNRLDFLTRADLFLMTSIWEGYPNALLEASACGVAAVSTDCGGGGARDILGPAAVCPLGDADALASAVLDRLAAAQPGGSHHPKPESIEGITSRYVDLALGGAVK